MSESLFVTAAVSYCWMLFCETLKMLSLGLRCSLFAAYLYSLSIYSYFAENGKNKSVSQDLSE